MRLWRLWRLLNEARTDRPRARRIVHLDVYGAKLEWEQNLEAARLAGVEIEKAVKEAKRQSRNRMPESLANWSNSRLFWQLNFYLAQAKQERLRRR
jgi:hypothetical protein